MSNLACRFITRGTNDRNAKLGQKGPGRGHVTCFRNLGIPSISREPIELETPNFARADSSPGVLYNDRNAKLGQKGQEGVT